MNEEKIVKMFRSAVIALAVTIPLLSLVGMAGGGDTSVGHQCLNI
jgi:hypothetical protein